MFLFVGLAWVVWFASVGWSGLDCMVGLDWIGWFWVGLGWVVCLGWVELFGWVGFGCLFTVVCVGLLSCAQFGYLFVNLFVFFENQPRFVCR